MEHTGWNVETHPTESDGLMNIKTKLYPRAENLGLNAYRKRTYYTLLVEQDVLARNKDEADELFRDGGGINYDRITADLALEDKGVETVVVDANYTSDTGNTEYLGKVVLNPDNDYAKEDGDVLLDPWSDETGPAEVHYSLKSIKENV
jgi:hypothetical protein